MAELLALAMALTGNAGTASDLVGAVLGRSSDGSDGAEPDAALRNRVVHCFVDTRGDPGPVDPVDDLTAELAAVAARLNRLSRLQRACTVLSVREGITQHEIAGLLDRPVSAVDRAVTGASFALGAPPYVLAATLDAVADRAPTPETARRAGGRFARRRSRSRRRGLTLLLAVVLIVASAVPLVIQTRGPYVRPSGDWSSGFTIRVPDAWEVESRMLAPDRETLILHARHGRSPTCMIRVVREILDPWPSGRELKVRGRAGVFGKVEQDSSAFLSWPVGTGATASVICPGPGARPDLAAHLDLADRIRFQQVPVKVPFDLRPVAPLVEVTSLQTAGDTVTAELMLSGEFEPSVTAVQLEMPGDEHPDRATTILEGPGATTRVYDADETVTVCVDVNGSSACATTTTSTTSTTENLTRYERAARTHQLLTLLGSVTFAGAPADPDSWFDARQAIPA